MRLFITALKRENKLKKQEPQLRKLRVKALEWCRRRDLNPHRKLDRLLRPERMPISPLLRINIQLEKHYLK